MMRIAVVAPTQIPATQANTVQVMKMSQAYAWLGHEVHLLVPHSGGKREQDWESLARHYGLQKQFAITWIPCRRASRKYDYGWKCVRWSRKWKANLLYTRLPQAAAFASLLSLPTIFEIHDFPRGRMGIFLFRIFIRGAGARRLVAISHALAQDLRDKLPLPNRKEFLIVAPDGVDLQRYQNLPSPLQARRALNLFTGKKEKGKKRETRRFVVGYTGSLYTGRGIELILELARYLPQMDFLIVGGTPREKEHLEVQARQLGLNNISIYSFVPNETLPLYQAACDVLLMPYQKRVAASSGGDIAPYLSPMKVFEYLASGRVILSSNLPVLLEVLNEQNAVLLPPDNVQAWIEALQHIYHNTMDYQKLVVQAKKDAQRYSWEQRARKILEGLPSS